MTEIVVHNFYRGGVHATAEKTVSRASSGADVSHTFGAPPRVEVSADPVEIGYTPRGNAKPISDAVHEVVEFEGKDFLLLNAGHVYSVTLLRPTDEQPQDHVISAESGHVSLPIPSGSEVEVSEYVAPDPAEAEGDDTTTEGADAAQEPGEGDEAGEDGDGEGTLGDEDGGDDEGAADEEE